MYIAKSVTKPAGISAGSAAAKLPNVIVFDMDEVLYYPPRDSRGIIVPGNIIMKPGNNMVEVYLTRSKISAPYESDGDEDSMNITTSFEGQHPGNKLEIREFIQNWLGRNVGIIHGSCAETEREIVGTPCAPLQLKPSKQDNNDGRFHMLKFEAFAKSQYLPGMYSGAITLAQPVTVADVASTELVTASGAIYQLPTLAVTAAVSISANDFVSGSMVSFIGGGGDAPATVENGVSGEVTILLKDGLAWEGTSGSTITFEVFDAGATTYLIEKTRS